MFDFLKQKSTKELVKTIADTPAREQAERDCREHGFYPKDTLDTAINRQRQYAEECRKEISRRRRQE